MTMWGKLLLLLGLFSIKAIQTKRKSQQFAPLAPAGHFIARNRHITEILESFDHWVIAKET